jgi:hypothetical protein
MTVRQLAVAVVDEKPQASGECLCSGHNKTAPLACAKATRLGLNRRDRQRGTRVASPSPQREIYAKTQ